MREPVKTSKGHCDKQDTYGEVEKASPWASLQEDCVADPEEA